VFAGELLTDEWILRNCRLLRHSLLHVMPAMARAEDRDAAKRIGPNGPNRNGAVTSAVLVHLRVEPAHFDWR
jgi:hypothetical protein